MDADEDDDEVVDSVEVPIDGILDLHTFAAREVKELVGDYLEACWERGIFEVRLIHGKGTGTLRKLVHAVLDRHPRVRGYRGGEVGEGGWGSTVVTLGE